jgi:hypothetical protein
MIEIYTGKMNGKSKETVTGTVLVCDTFINSSAFDLQFGAGAAASYVTALAPP